eukprot:CAMPEP_0116114902 /NCGR_PEP_ID=MMETSP0329-20121206/221_1 /TAXON_ID=697910 /ORGANISM="Pseudo-nitzschia arenysensis, Strain B593" /LENGTH=210 /DNA_ID=CAMNT_0003608299 /DNA_START=341 /DNA_END=973 /DNA_ORIENTATION=+
MTLDDVHVAQTRFNSTLLNKNFFTGKYGDIPIDLTGVSDAYTPPLICSHGNTKLDDVNPYFVKMAGKRIRYSCAMQVTEYQWDRNAQSVYTVIREPFSHTLSQYFHCTESSERIKKNKTSSMTLDEWLGAYANAYDNLTDEKLGKKEKNELTRNLFSRFHCYNPIESETEYTRFPTIPKDYFYPYPKTKDHLHRDDEAQLIDRYLFNGSK